MAGADGRQTHREKENVLMRSNIMRGAAAAAMIGTVLLASPASARSWHHRGGGFAAGVAGFAAGALIGGALASRPYGYGLGYYG
jgi:hypothetical protein